MRKHFRTHPRLQIISHGEISRVTGYETLYRLDPDLLIIDEGHAFKEPAAARTRRLTRFIKDHPDTKLLVMSATPSKKSIMEYQHLLRWCLGKEGTPLPPYPEIEMWADALDLKPRGFMAPGVLEEFCLNGENVQIGWNRRLGTTPGVILLKTASTEKKLTIHGRKIDVPRNIKDHIIELSAKWRTAGGEGKSHAR